MEQQNGEKVDQFVCRLRQKAITCDFTDVDETIRDQLIQKCQDQKFRRKVNTPDRTSQLDQAAEISE